MTPPDLFDLFLATAATPTAEEVPSRYASPKKGLILFKILEQLFQNLVPSK